MAASIPAAAQFLEAAFQRGESVATQTAQLLRLVEDYGTPEVTAAVAEALQRGTPSASTAAFLHDQRQRAASPSYYRFVCPPIPNWKLSSFPIPNWRLTMNSQTPKMIPSPDLPIQLARIGLKATAAGLDDFLDRATQKRWSPL
ncbi:MAG: hypothetical protein EXQ58_05950 [Acidobacteria bacterium]|nr:hypothetical protein [Acidobacteriota bacterium]